MPRTQALVLGLGDIGSAVAHRLFSDGMAVVLYDVPMPTTTRRQMAFADAAFDGSAQLDGVEARRVNDAEGLQRLLTSRDAIPVASWQLTGVLRAITPQVVVDARMRKHERPEVIRGLAPLTIGLGPGYEVGRVCDIAVETSWDDLGAVIHHGAPLPLAGEPRELGGYARERYIYAPVGGVFRTRATIGDAVHGGEDIGIVGDVTVQAPVSGVIRGLTRDGVSVTARTKILEIDPRGRPTFTGMGERPRRIAEGVAVAIASTEGQRLMRRGERLIASPE